MPRKTTSFAATAMRREKASMRPRPDAAENVGVGARDARRHRRASMRPRPDAAENLLAGRYARRRVGASMRPRPDAAENARRSSTISCWYFRFNEAAARCRGKPRPFPPTRFPAPPRFNEAAARCRGKPTPTRAAPRRLPARFNEAAARCRGKPSPCPARAARSIRFNEAAARCRGKPMQRYGHIDRVHASMRPRPDAAENIAIPASDLPAGFSLQ